MLDPAHPIAQLLREDKRYKLEAYVFVFDALNYAHTALGLGGKPRDVSSDAETKPKKRGPKREKEKEKEEEEESVERHLTGQQLCEAIRLFALEQYGLMAKCVLNEWGVHNTGDFGEIVFNLIRIEQMRKTADDRREDFDNVFDFDTDLAQRFKIEVPETKTS